MIRINLLPAKRAKIRVTTGEPGSKEFAIGMAALLGLAAVVFFAVDQPKRSKLSSLREATSNLAGQIAQAQQTDLKGCAEVEKKKKDLDERAESIQRLMNAKVVPANVLHELGEILTNGHKPTMTDDVERKTIGPNAEPNRRYDPNWDPSHVWLLSYVDENGNFSVEGGAQAEVDVTQLSKRMQASVYFADVAPSHQERVADKESGISYYHFTITGKVAY